LYHDRGFGKRQIHAAEGKRQRPPQADAMPDALTKVDAFLAFGGGSANGPHGRRDLRRGEVYAIAYDQPARRVVIVSSDDLNAAERDFVKVVMITNTAPPQGAGAFSVAAATLENAGDVTGYIMCDSLTNLARSYFTGLKPRHQFRGGDVLRIDAALQAALDLSASV
jgi:mRNA-degrading endonuclease toxin of MazEF toxin-antitoxin module